MIRIGEGEVVGARDWREIPEGRKGMMVTERERQMNDQTEQLESAAPDVSSRQVEVLHLVEALRNEMRDGFQRVEQRIEEVEQRIEQRIEEVEQGLGVVKQRVRNVESESAANLVMLGKIEKLDGKFEKYLNSWRGPALEVGMNMVHFLMWGTVIVVALRVAGVIGP